MKTIRKTLCLLLCAALLLSLCGCAGKEKQEETAAAPQEAERAQSAGAAPSFDQQRRILEAARSLWEFSEPYYESPWFYTFTDLDHNGRLEVIAATTQGTGIFTYALFWELAENFSELREVWHESEEIEGPEDWPEIIMSELTGYHDEASERWYYVCENTTRSGMAHHYYSWNALCLKDGAAEWELLASKSVDWDENGAEHVECLDAQGNPITEQEYASAAATRFEGYDRSEIALEWTQVDIPSDENRPSIFDEPEATEAPAAQTPVPAPASSATARFKISKNPTSEALAIGGKTWFIAHADNGVAPTWFLQSPDNQLYSLSDAMAAHPGLQLEALPQDTIAVSNVPLSVNGWGVVARFDGDGGSLYTEPAYLYVGDFVTAYGSVIEKYRAAYANTDRNPGYAFENGISEFIVYSEHVGYALKDLDKDGTPELIIAGIGNDEFADKIVFDLYTLSNGWPVQLACSQARDRYSLRSDSLLINEGSSGAAYSNVFLFAVKGGGLEAKEGVIVYDGSCYYQNGSCDYEPRSGDKSITMDEYTAKWDGWKSVVYIPQL
ncbi:MAG: hypothetical protein IKS25_01900, partial [Oscillospiraceae bacterium]|nr:hypothetical protein [Oscillospiraceae bacterium]